MTPKTIKPLLLSDLKKGDCGKILKVATADKNILKKLAAMGLFPGVKVKVIQRLPSCLFQVGHSQFAADKALVSTIEIDR